MVQLGGEQLFVYMLLDAYGDFYLGDTDYDVVWTVEGYYSDYTVFENGILTICEYEEAEVITLSVVLYVDGVAISYDVAEAIVTLDEVEDLFTATLAAGQLGVLWEMQADPGILGIALGTAFTGNNDPVGVNTPVIIAGDATITAVAHPVSGVSLQATTRNGDWHGLQVRHADLVALGMNLSLHSYTISITDRRTAPLGAGGAVMQLRGQSEPWANMAASPSIAATDGAAFTINWSIVPATLNQRDFRIQSAHATTGFTVDNIIITRTAVLPAGFTLSANGSPGVATTSEIEINLARAIALPNLELADITFTAGMTGATATGLRRINDTQYILDITGATRWGGASIAIAHGDVATASQSVTLHHIDFVIDLRPNAPLRPYFPWINGKASNRGASVQRRLYLTLTYRRHFCADSPYM